MDDLLEGLLEGAVEVAGGAVELAGEAAEWAFDAAGELLETGTDAGEQRRRRGDVEGDGAEVG